MFLFDSTYILVIIGLVITLGASAKLRSTYALYSRKGASCGMTGAMVARRILEANGIYDVSVGQVSGSLTDHYDPSKKVVNLSPEIFGGTSIASIGVAAHECGHAIQDSESYGPMRLRAAFVPVANFGSKAGWLFIIAGIFLGGILKNATQAVFNLGIILFSLSVVFQLITLPVEYNASSRAVAQLEGLNILTAEEHRGARKVLSAAALTYVASATAGILQVLRLVLIFGGRGNRD